MCRRRNLCSCKVPADLVSKRVGRNGKNARSRIIAARISSKNGTASPNSCINHVLAREFATSILALARRADLKLTSTYRGRAPYLSSSHIWAFKSTAEYCPLAHRLDVAAATAAADKETKATPFKTEDDLEDETSTGVELSSIDNLSRS